eukprot:gnl/Chilomastix_cuspidata/6087.p1 GENE.gnl/Chilomastix_cuspidata/6087~~gnl/Chilomastix_cuspidata/6087.p1  ORF type:complete len:408 (-),score=97.97 gnl/Chilomastix_cuspidata/6087:49-1272(-)
MNPYGDRDFMSGKKKAQLYITNSKKHHPMRQHHLDTQHFLNSNHLSRNTRKPQLYEQSCEPSTTSKGVSLYFLQFQEPPHAPHAAARRQPKPFHPKTLVPNPPGDHIAFRYEVLMQLSCGDASSVFAVRDHKIQCDRAIKVFHDTPAAAERGAAEASVLRGLLEGGDCSEIVRLFKSFTFRSHRCLVFELLSSDLQAALPCASDGRFAPCRIRAAATQLLRALLSLKLHSIVHGNLTPDNVLLEASGALRVKLGGFGAAHAARALGPALPPSLYRAPEVALGRPHGLPADMWSLGCVLAELALGRPLFASAKCAPPAARGVHTAPSSVSAQSDAADAAAARPLCTLFPSSEKEFALFLEGLLERDPSRRLTPEQALSHRWLAQHADSGLDLHESALTPVETDFMFLL